jgi:hypothetical protein
MYPGSLEMTQDLEELQKARGAGDLVSKVDQQSSVVKGYCQYEASIGIVAAVGGCCWRELVEEH